jgi:Ca2+-binding EF-hand superfamily protein
LNISVSQNYLKKIFKEYDKDGSNYIEWEEFKNLLKDFNLKKELIPIFENYCKEA